MFHPQQTDEEKHDVWEIAQPVFDSRQSTDHPAEADSRSLFPQILERMISPLSSTLLNTDAYEGWSDREKLILLKPSQIDGACYAFQLRKSSRVSNEENLSLK